MKWFTGKVEIAVITFAIVWLLVVVASYAYMLVRYLT